MKDSTAVVLWAAREGRHGNPLGSPGRDDTGILWAAPGGTTRESSGQPREGRHWKVAPGATRGSKAQRPEPRQGWKESGFRRGGGLAGVSGRHPFKPETTAAALLSTPAGVLRTILANPGLHPGLLSSVAPAGAAQRIPVSSLPGLPRGFPCRPSQGCPEDSRASLLRLTRGPRPSVFHLPSTLHPPPSPSTLHPPPSPSFAFVIRHSSFVIRHSFILHLFPDT